MRRILFVFLTSAICHVTPSILIGGIIKEAYPKVNSNGSRNMTTDFNGGMYCPSSGTDCDMVVTTENPDGSYTTDVVYPCGILVHVPVGSVQWIGVEESGFGSFANMTFLPGEYTLQITHSPTDPAYNSLTVSLNGVTADSEGWIHVFVPHP